MEIEKKFRVKHLPEALETYEKKVIEQGYLCSNPIVRIRKSNEEYILTYKSKFGIDKELSKLARVCNEVEVPLTDTGYEHLKQKVDNKLVRKDRYIIPLENGLKAELDIFKDHLEGLTIVEVEFQDEEAIHAFVAPEWFGEEVSQDKRFSNNYLSGIDNWVE
ncbi:MAG: CYTH domain-containing protein [bacterium]|nr:CYTH domain-containing protein [bacterium]